MIDIVSLRLGRDLRQSEAYGNFMRNLGWQVDQISGVRIFSRLIGPLHFAKIRRPSAQIDWSELQEYIRSQKLLITRVDPESGQTPAGFNRDKDQDLGTKTLLIDLRPKDEQIITTFRPETRTKLNKLFRGKHNTAFNDFSGFYHLLRTGLSDLDVWCPPLSQYQAFISAFGDDCFCVNIDNQSGCLVIFHQGVAEYYYAGSTRAGKSANLPYLAVWQAMLEAKNRGAQVWDFNGLIDPRWPDKKWAGFSFFKTRFGGTELSFTGTYTKYGWW